MCCFLFLQSIPGGFNALRRLYTDIQEPMLNAAQEQVRTLFPGHFLYPISKYLFQSMSSFNDAFIPNTLSGIRVVTAMVYFVVYSVHVYSVGSPGYLLLFFYNMVIVSIIWSKYTRRCNRCRILSLHLQGVIKQVNVLTIMFLKPLTLTDSQSDFFL